MYKNCIMEINGQRVDTTIDINEVTSLNSIEVLNDISDPNLFVVIDGSIWLVLYADEINNYDCYLTVYLRR